MDRCASTAYSPNQTAASTPIRDTCSSNAGPLVVSILNPSEKQVSTLSNPRRSCSPSKPVASVDMAIFELPAARRPSPRHGSFARLSPALPPWAAATSFSCFIRALAASLEGRGASLKSVSHPRPSVHRSAAEKPGAASKQPPTARDGRAPRDLRPERRRLAAAARACSARFPSVRRAPSAVAEASADLAARSWPPSSSRCRRPKQRRVKVGGHAQDRPVVVGPRQ